MRDRTNCPNCGAPLSSDICEYCKTTFYDLASLEDGAPCYMRVRYGNMLLTFKAIPRIQTLTSTTESSSIVSSGRTIATYNTGRSMDMEVVFGAIANKDGKLFTIEIDTK